MVQPCPDSLLKKERFAFIKGVPKMLGSPYEFKKYGQSGAELSPLLPHLSKVVDDIAIVRSMYTEQFNHAPAQLFLNTGSAQLGRPSMGSWLTYGLGSENQNLPGFVVLISSPQGPDAARVCGAADSCQVNIKVCNSVRRVIRYCTSAIHRGLMPHVVVVRWMRYRI